MGWSRVPGDCINCGCPTFSLDGNPAEHHFEKDCIKALKTRIANIESTMKLLQQTRTPTGFLRTGHAELGDNVS